MKNRARIRENMGEKENDPSICGGERVHSPDGSKSQDWARPRPVTSPDLSQEGGGLFCTPISKKADEQSEPSQLKPAFWYGLKESQGVCGLSCCFTTSAPKTDVLESRKRKF